jgi:hypothetical protein
MAESQGLLNDKDAATFDSWAEKFKENSAFYELLKKTGALSREQNKADAQAMQEATAHLTEQYKLKSELRDIDHKIVELEADGADKHTKQLETLRAQRKELEGNIDN